MIDVRELGLHTLRSRMCMIPQEPVLFEGTVRSNVDILQEFSDDQIWNVLEIVGLKDYVSSLSEKLSAAISEGGGNMSAGQKQLLYLAMALLKRPKILVLDEATSSVDTITDQKIQSILLEQFCDTTIISIAHRIHTVARFDHILVLDEGKRAEYGTPQQLLADKNTLFSAMVDASGASNAQLIRTLASS